MKTLQMFIEQYQSLHQREQKSRQSVKNKYPQKNLPMNLTFSQLVLELKKNYEIEKREEMVKGLMSNPTHLDKIDVTPLENSSHKSKT